jgi:hypothetical protein
VTDPCNREIKPMEIPHHALDFDTGDSAFKNGRGLGIDRE